MPVTQPKPKTASAPVTDERFGEFVEHHRARALRLAWRLVGGDDALAEDVAQEAFIKAYRALPRFRRDAELSTWFYRILVHQAHSTTRKRATRRRLLELFRRGGGIESEIAPSWPDPGLRRRIAQALTRLTHAQREAFVLVHMEGYSVNETARIVQRAPGTVKSHLHRALTKLRLELADLAPASASKGARL